MLEKHRNANGTYNGVTALAELSGLDPREIRWTFDRIKALRAAGKSSSEAKAIVRSEAQGKPWL